MHSEIYDTLQQPISKIISPNNSKISKTAVWKCAVETMMYYGTNDNERLDSVALWLTCYFEYDIFSKEKHLNDFKFNFDLPELDAIYLANVDLLGELTSLIPGQNIEYTSVVNALSWLADHMDNDVYFINEIKNVDNITAVRKKILESNIIFDVIIHQDRGHFTLLASLLTPEHNDANMLRSTLFFFDSYLESHWRKQERSMNDAVKAFDETIKELTGFNIQHNNRIIVKNVPQQQDACSCGVFVFWIGALVLLDAQFCKELKLNKHGKRRLELCTFSNDAIMNMMYEKGDKFADGITELRHLMWALVVFWKRKQHKYYSMHNQ